METFTDRLQWPQIHILNNINAVQNTGILKVLITELTEAKEDRQRHK